MAGKSRTVAFIFSCRAHRRGVRHLVAGAGARAAAARDVRAGRLPLVPETFDSEIAPVYGKTEDGLRAPLRHVDIDRALPPDLAFIQVERFTPVFVLVDKGREIGRIRGYGGEEMFLDPTLYADAETGRVGNGRRTRAAIRKNVARKRLNSVM